MIYKLNKYAITNYSSLASYYRTFIDNLCMIRHIYFLTTIRTMFEHGFKMLCCIHEPE